MRAFFAVKPAPEICLAIDHWRSQNWPLLDKPVPIANFHITLTFLGNITERQLEYLERGAADINQGGFDLELNTLGYWHKPALMWLGSDEAPETLLALAGKTKQLAKSAGLKIDKRSYLPHLTLSRKVTSPPTAALIEPCFACHFERLSLYESITRPTGAQYREITGWNL